LNREVAWFGIVDNEHTCVKESSPAAARLPLKTRFAKAASWVLLGQVLENVLRLGGNLILARLMVPDVFGIMAVASVVHVIVALLADIGVRQAVIQSPNGGKQSLLNTAWTLQILRGFLIWAICLVLSLALHIADAWSIFPTGTVYADPVLPSVIAAVSFSAVLTGFQSMKSASANRAIDLKRLTMIGIAAQIASLCVAIGFGWLTGSLWSFVASGLASAMLSTLLSHVWLRGPADRLAWDRDALHELLRFGRWVFVSSFFYVLAMNGDRVMLGAWATPALLGYYSIAFTLTNVIDSTATRLFTAVSMPALSEIARTAPHRVPNLFFRMRSLTDVVYVGLAGFFFATGAWIIGFLYDSRYAPAGPLLQFLSFSLLFSRYNLVTSVYLALGRPEYQSYVNVVRAVSLFVLVPISYHLFGFEGAIVGIACHTVPTLPLIFWLNSRHRLNNILFEFAVLLMWPVGWAVGHAFISIARNISW
jgi:O-antigen/teichoic acid export membrane protein